MLNKKTVRAVAFGFSVTVFFISFAFAQEFPFDEKVTTRLSEVLVERTIDDFNIRTRGRVNVIAKYLNSVPLVISGDATGSATVVRTGLAESMSLVITNAHVVNSPFIDIDGRAFVLLVFHDSQLASEPFEQNRISGCARSQNPSGWCRAFHQSVRPAVVIGSDVGRDLALLLVQNAPKAAVEIPMGQIDAIKPGDDVFVLGHPFDLLWSLSTGVVSAVRRQFPTGVPPNKTHVTVIQTQTPVNPGNSGGPMLTPEGRLVGIIFAQGIGQLIAGASGASAKPAEEIRVIGSGINFAVGVNEVQSAVASFNERMKR